MSEFTNLNEKFLSFSFILLAALSLNPAPAESANIVFFFGISSYSHRFPAWPLAEELAEQGHNITFISPFPAKNPNPKIFDYVPLGLEKWTMEWDDEEDVFKDRKESMHYGYWLNGWLSMSKFGIELCEVLYSDEDFLRWMDNSKVDLIILDALWNDCAFGLVHKFQAKLILYATTTAFAWYTESYGMPDVTSSISDMMHALDAADMSLKNRIKNAITPVAWYLYRKWRYFPAIEKITKEKLGPGVTEGMQSFEDIEKNTSLVFLNIHWAEEFARSLPPNVVSVGGIAWTGKRKPLPKDLDNFLERGKEFIYISFGTYADFRKMPYPTQQAILEAIRALPEVQFVWKMEDTSIIEEFPAKNVYVDKWLPQQDILAHPKIRAFITHAGLIGIQEAVYAAVPLISFPIFAEQDYNSERIHRKEYGIRLEINTVTKSELENAIRLILTDSKYKRNMQQVSSLFQDRPQKPLETALWWTNYVLRHSPQELAQLRPLSVVQPWWVRRQLDVWLVIGAIISVLLISIGFVLFKVIKCLCFSKKSNGNDGQIQKMRKKVE